MNGTQILEDTKLGYGFLPDQFIPEGKDEYYLRDGNQDFSSYRHLSAEEIQSLIKRGNICLNWDDILVLDPFDPSCITASKFYGLVRIGSMKQECLQFHDFIVPEGIHDTRILSSDIGSHCAISHCLYIANYAIRDRVILHDISELQSTNHAKFGNGIVKEGETEEVRVNIDIMNEAGGRGIYPFSDIIPADAYLWAKYRDDSSLMVRLKELTDAFLSPKRGYYSVIEESSVIKGCRIIKDVHVGPCAYIKGANKLKNLTIRSTSEESTQIGEGVELVNGIIGAGSRVFYGCKAIRFVMGDHCNLKYGARLIHSILGDNSTISCCEVLNNLIFPFHEQHHNNSFLIATLIKGQSNMAAGATIGSNHNSRGNDGELVAGRGFWPALSSTLKHDCFFASYTLIAKGSYPHELNLRLPFSLLSNDEGDRRTVLPAYWWRHNMYALERNSWKFKSRDKRKVVRQFIETDYLAPDTAAEILNGMRLLCRWTAQAYSKKKGVNVKDEKLEEYGRDILENDSQSIQDIAVYGEFIEAGDAPVQILKVAEGYKAYKEMLLYYGTKSVFAYCFDHKLPLSEFTKQVSTPLHAWLNMGGQLVPESKVDKLKKDIKERKINTWEEVHATYARWQKDYEFDKARNGLKTLRILLGKKELIPSDWVSLAEHLKQTRSYIETEIVRTKAKDYDNYFRMITYRNEDERNAVLGRVEDNPFVSEGKKTTKAIMRTAQCVAF